MKLSKSEMQTIIRALTSQIDEQSATIETFRAANNNLRKCCNQIANENTELRNSATPKSFSL